MKCGWAWILLGAIIAAVAANIYFAEQCASWIAWC